MSGAHRPAILKVDATAGHVAIIVKHAAAPSLMSLNTAIARKITV